MKSRLRLSRSDGDRPKGVLQPLSPALLVLAPLVVLVVALAWRLTQPPLARAVPRPTGPAVRTAPPAPIVSTATPPPPTPTTVPTETPLPATPTIDATEIARRAALVATLTAPPPTATTTPTPAPRFLNDGGIYRRADAPITLRIPKIGVDAPVESVGLDATGAMATPTTPFRVAWYDGGPLPGQPGNAVIDGHLDSAIYGRAVFWNLAELTPGDRIQVEMPGDRWLSFVVQRVAVYPYNEAPIQEIFGPAPTPRLNLITCSGIFNHSTHNYDRRRVVYSVLAE